MKCLLGTLILAVLIGLPQIANPQTPDLSPKAQEAFSRGLVAAQQQEWRVAIRHFLDAHKADPDAPQIWFNLGLASSKLPGWELRAIAWLKAYQEAVPNAPNAKAIQELVTGLGARFEGNIGRLTEQLVPAGRELSKKDEDLRKKRKNPEIGDRIELPYAAFLLLRDEASAKRVEPTQPTGIIIQEGQGGVFTGRPSFVAIALARAGEFQKAVALARASPKTTFITGDELIEYLLSQSRLDDAVDLVRALDSDRSSTFSVKIACKAREMEQMDLVNQMFSAVKDAVARRSKESEYSDTPAYFDFALWLGQAEEINRSSGLLQQYYANKGLEQLKKHEQRRREEVGKLPPACRGAWWLKGERRAFLLKIATKGVEITVWDEYPRPKGEFDETRFKEATEFAKQIKDKNYSDGAMTALLLGLVDSAYAYRNINP